MAKKTMSQLVVEVSADVARLKQDMNKMRGEVNHFTESATKMFKGMAAAMAGYFSFKAVKAGLQETLSSFMEYETALTRIGNVSKESMSGIEEKLKTLGPEYGTLTEMARGYYSTLSAGVTDAVKSIDVLTTAAKVSKEASIEQSDAVKAISAVMSAYGKELKTASDAADFLYTIEKQGITTVGELTPLIGSLANQAAALNVTSNQLGAGLAQVTKAGQGTAEATTQLQALLTSLTKPTTEMRDLLEQYGGAQLAIKELGFAGVLKKIAEETQGNTEALGEYLGSKEAMLAFFQIMKDSFKQYSTNFTDMTEKAGAFKDAWDRYAQTLKAVLETFKDTVGNIAIEIGGTMAPLVKEMITDMGNWLQTMKDPIVEKFKGWMESLESAFVAMRTYVADVVDDFRAWYSSSEAIMKTGLVGWLKDDFIPGVREASSAVKSIVSSLKSVKEAAENAWSALKKVAEWTSNPGSLVQETSEYVVKFMGEGSTKKPIIDKINEIRDTIGKMKNYMAENSELSINFLGKYKHAESPLSECMEEISAAEEELRAQIAEPMEMTIDTTPLRQALESISNYYMNTIGNMLAVFGKTMDPGIENAMRNQIERMIAAWNKAQEAAKTYFGEGGRAWGLGQYALGGYTGDKGGYVHPREFVIPSDAVSYYGINILEAIRKKTLEREAFMVEGAGGKSGGSSKGRAGYSPPTTINKGRVTTAGVVNVNVNSQFMTGDSAEARRTANAVQAMILKYRRQTGAVPYAHGVAN